MRLCDSFRTGLQVDHQRQGPVRNHAARSPSWLSDCAIDTGLLTVFVQHTSASLTIQENADPDVVYDLNAFFNRLVAEDNRLYRHTCEGPDDMPAHIRGAIRNSGAQKKAPGRTPRESR